MAKKIVDLKEYKAKKTIKKQISQLDDLYDEYMVHETDPIVRQGYVNFMRFLEALDKKYGEDNDK